MICLSVRRFLCRDADCARVTFVEQVAGLTRSHARCSPGLTSVLQAIALTAGGPEELLMHDGTGRRPSILDGYEPYLRERWNSSATNAALVWREIRARGYASGYAAVSRGERKVRRVGGVFADQAGRIRAWRYI